MHPIERLRYVARASGADQAILVRETAAALADLGFDPAGLVTSCRRIVDRHPTSGPLWTLCARVLTAGDPEAAAWELARELQGDTTATELSYALGDEVTVVTIGWPELVGEALPARGDLRVLAVDALGEGSGLARRLRRVDMVVEEVAPAGLGGAAISADVVLLEASAMGPTGFLAVAGSRAAACVARDARVPVWLVCGVGRALAGPMWNALATRFADRGDPWEMDDEVVPLALVDVIVGPSGLQEVPTAVQAMAGLPIAPELFRPTAF